MDRFRYVILVSLLGFVIGLVPACAPAYAESWDLATDYSNTANPMGAWTLGYMMPDGTVTPYDTNSEWAAGCRTWISWTNPIDSGYAGNFAKNTTDSVATVASSVIEIGQVFFQPASVVKAAARWTSPVNGYVLISAKFTGRDYTGNCTVDPHVLKNGVSIYDGYVWGFYGSSTKNYSDRIGSSPEQAFSTIVEIAVNDTIDFACGDGGNGYSFDGAAMEATVTTVSGLAMIHGKITSDEVGNPEVAGVRVYASGASGTYEGFSDAFGEYSIAVSPGTFDVSFSKASYETQTISATVALGQDVELNCILRTGFITGMVTTTGSDPIVGAVVSTSDGLHSAVTGSDGSYSMQLPPGDYSLVASAGGYVTSDPVPVSVTGSITQDFELALKSVFSAVDDFSIRANPSGLWSYGYQLWLGLDLNYYDVMTPYIVGLQAWHNTGGDWSGHVVKNTLSEAVYHGGQYEAGALNVQCGSSGQIATVRWKSPLSGYVAIDANFMGKDVGGTTTDVHVLKNGASVYLDGNLNGYVGTLANNYADGFGPAREQHFAAILPIAVGDIIDFAVGWGLNGNYASDCTGLDATITPVATVPGTISGQVTSSQSGAIAGATVRIAGTNYMVTTDASGNYSMSVPEGSYTLEAQAQGYSSATADVTVTSGANTSQNFQLEGGYVSGKVLRADDSAPIVGAIINSADGVYSAVSGADGSYSMPQMPSGSATFLVKAGGYDALSVDLTIPAGSTLLHDFAMTPEIVCSLADDFVDKNPNGVWQYGYTLTLGETPTLLDLYGMAMPAAIPLWISYKYNNEFTAYFIYNNKTTPATNGTAVIEPGKVICQPGPYNTMATARWTSPVDGYVSIDAKFTGQDYTGGCTVDPHVLKNGVSIYDGYVSGFYGSSANNYTDRTGTSPEQTFSTVVPIAKNDTLDFVVGYGGNDYGCDSAGIEVSIAQTTVIPGSISGKVVRAGDNAPIVGAIISSADGVHSAVSGADGSYSMPQMPSGSATFLVKAGGYDALSVDLTIPAGSTLPYDFAMTPEIVCSLADDFIDKNPNGVWQYGYTLTLGETPTLLDLYGLAMPAGIPLWISYKYNNEFTAYFIYNNKTTVEYNGTAVIEPGKVICQPGPYNTMATARWTSPVNGYVLIDTKFTGQDYSGACTVDPHVLKNGVSLYDGYVSGFYGSSVNNYTDRTGTSPEQTFSTIVPIAKNDTLDFVVGYGGNDYGCDSPGIEVSIAQTTLISIDSIDEIKNLEDPTAISLAGSAVVTGAFDGFFYVEDPSRTSGIKVISSASVAIDDVVSLTGVVGTVNGERVINAMSVNKVGTAHVGPLAASGRSLVGAGGPSTGLLVKTWGNVTYVDPSGAFAYVDDGSQLNDGNADGHIGVMVMLAGSGLTDVTSTNFLIVSGPLGRASNGTVVVPVIWAASGSKNP